MPVWLFCGLVRDLYMLNVVSVEGESNSSLITLIDIHARRHTHDV